MTGVELLSTVSAFLIVLALYSYVLVDIAATVAVKRIERQLDVALAEVEDLDRMWEDSQ